MFSNISCYQEAGLVCLFDKPIKLNFISEKARFQLYCNHETFFVPTLHCSISYFCTSADENTKEFENRNTSLKIFSSHFVLFVFGNFSAANGESTITNRNRDLLERTPKTPETPALFFRF